MRIDTENARFTNACAGALSSHESSCFQCLVRQLDGMYPTTLVAVAESVGFKFEACDWHMSIHSWDRILVGLPFPHIVDGDWRYTASTAAELVDLAQRHAGRSGRFLHIGSPSTYKVALAGRDAKGTHVLADRNAFLHDVDALVDLRRAQDADIALLDPPWYEEESVAFLAHAAAHIRTGGLILLAQPGALTRPGVDKERTNLINAAGKLGLEHVTTLSNFTRYETPHFEHVTLNRTLSMRVPADWRTGDLLVLICRGTLEQPSIPPALENSRNEDWQEMTLGPVRLKYRASPGSPTFSQLTSTGMPSSVSRRDPLRSKIGIWTSGNRVYGCDDGELLVRSVNRLQILLDRSALTPSATAGALIACGVDPALATKASYSIIDDVMEHLRYG